MNSIVIKNLQLPFCSYCPYLCRLYWYGPPRLLKIIKKGIIRANRVWGGKVSCANVPFGLKLSGITPYFGIVDTAKSSAIINKAHSLKCIIGIPWSNWWISGSIIRPLWVGLQPSYFKDFDILRDVDHLGRLGVIFKTCNYLKSLKIQPAKVSKYCNIFRFYHPYKND